MYVCLVRFLFPSWLWSTLEGWKKESALAAIYIYMYNVLYKNIYIETRYPTIVDMIFV